MPHISVIVAEPSLVLPRFSFSPAAVKAKAEALALAKQVLAVTIPAEQAVAVAAQTELVRARKQAEATRKAAKEPAIVYGREVDTAAKVYCAEIEAEELRVSKLIADYQALELMKARAAQQAENERLLALEREKAAELARVETHEEAEAIQERYNDRAAAEALPVPEPAKVAGQTVTEDWNFEVTDIWLLARAHPGCVAIEPRRAEIKALLKAGVKMAGIRAWKETKAGVRIGAQPVPIDV